MIVLTSPAEIAFKIHNFPIYYYGIILGLAAFFGFYFSYFITKKYYKEINPEILYDIIPFVILSGIICARLYYCALNFDYYIANPHEIFNTRQGGLAIHGGILGGLIFGCIYAYLKKLPLLKLTDISTYGLILAQIIGRWGNFFNNEAYGQPTSKFIAVYIPKADRIQGYEYFSYFQPTFLYESVCNLLILLFLFFVIRKYSKNFDGLIFASYLILYSIVRYIIESVRLDCIANIGTLHLPQFVSIIMFLCGIILICYQLYTKNKQNHQ